MKALVLNSIKQQLDLEDRSELHAGPGEAIVQMKAAAFNRRDYWITQGMYPGIKTPAILGSDGAGVVSKVGHGVDTKWLGSEVILNPGLGWGDEQAAQAVEFHILGMPQDGTFATEISIPASQLHQKPEHLSWVTAAGLPLAGVTAYRAVFSQGGLQSGDTMVITGIGGGVATFALQFAVAAGAEVWVTSSSDQKIQRAVELGAKGGFNYKSDTWWIECADRAGAPDLIVDGAGGAGYGALLDLAAPGGRIVNYGATAGPPPQLDLFKVFWKQLHLIGSTMGSPSDFSEMIRFVEKHEIHPIVDAEFPLENGNDAIAQMESSPQFGKYVLTMPAI